MRQVWFAAHRQSTGWSSIYRFQFCVSIEYMARSETKVYGAVLWSVAAYIGNDQKTNTVPSSAIH
jgi:hypothetical protein